MLLFFFKANSYAVGFAVRSKRTFQYVRMSFHPENVGNWSFSTQNESEVSLRSIYPELFPACLLYTSPSPRDGLLSRMPSSA